MLYIRLIHEFTENAMTEYGRIAFHKRPEMLY